MNSLYVSMQPFLSDSSVVTKCVVTPNIPVLLLQPVSVVMLVLLSLIALLTAYLYDSASLAVVSLVRGHCRPVEMLEVAVRAGISDDLQVNLLDMMQQGLL